MKLHEWNESAWMKWKIYVFDINEIAGYLANVCGVFMSFVRWNVVEFFLEIIKESIC